MDPRTSVIGKRLEGVKRIIAVSGGKGGVGKSVTSSLLSLALSKCGEKVGLLDLDLSSPSDHVILGIKGLYPEEENGIIPPEFHGVRFMSVTLFAKDEPTPLRGDDITNAIRELLCITRWENLDFLIIDMPPGMGDELFETIELLKRCETILVTIPSKVAFETVKKLSLVLREMRSPIIGVIENMKREEKNFIQRRCKEINLNYLGSIRFDEKLEDAIGDVEKIMETKVYRDVLRIAEILKEEQKG